jgi:hypothetical protein
VIASDGGTVVSLSGFFRMRGSRYEDTDLDQATRIDAARTFYDARAHATLSARRGGVGGLVSLDLAGTDFDDGLILGNENPAINRPSGAGLRHLWIEYAGAVTARLGRQPARLGHSIVTHVARDAFRVWKDVGDWTLNAALVKGGETVVNAVSGEDDDLDAVALFVQRRIAASTLRIEWARQFDSSPDDRFPEKQFLDVNASGSIGEAFSYRAEAAYLGGRPPDSTGESLDYEASVVFVEAHLDLGLLEPGLRAGRGSGDDDPSDGVQGNFASLFLDETHFAYTNLFADDIHGWDGTAGSLGRGAGFANVTFIQPRLRVSGTADLDVEASVTFLWATVERTVGTGPLGDRAPAGSDLTRDLGLEFDVTGTHALGDGATLGANLGWFAPGKVYGEGAADALKAEIWLEYGF